METCRPSSLVEADTLQASSEPTGWDGDRAKAFSLLNLRVKPSGFKPTGWDGDLSAGLQKISVDPF